MTLQQIAEFVCEKTGYTDAKSVDACKKFIRARYQMVWDSELWRETLGADPFQCGQDSDASSPSIITLRDNVAEVIAVRKEDSEAILEYVNLIDLFKLDVQLHDGTDQENIVAFTAMMPAATFYGPMELGSTSGKMIFSSSSTEDTTQQVSIIGEGVGGFPFREVLTLNGTNEVETTDGYNYQTAFSIGLNAPATGLITIKEDNAGDPIAYIEAGQFATPLYTRIKVFERPAGGSSFVVLYKRRAPALRNDGDSPLLRNIDNALIAYASGDMLERARQYAKAKDKFGEGESLRKVAIGIEKGQAANITRIIPDNSGNVSFHSILGI